jgi:tetratricopeptide (TPR) repeat protein
MKKVLMLVCFVMLPASILFSLSDHASLYNRANEQYAQGQYREALTLYSELLERGVRNPSLYYNTANTYFKLGQVGYARLFYERALLLAPFDRDVRNNLKYLTGALEERIVPLYSESIFRNISGFASYITLRMLSFIELFFFTAFVVTAHLFLLVPSARDRVKRWVYTTALLFALFLAGTVSYYLHAKNHPDGVVTGAQIEILSAPVPESEILFTLYEGTKATLKESRGEWIRISIADGRQGWARRDRINFI